MDRPLLETALDDGGNVKRQLSGYRLGETIAASTTGLTVECYQDREHLVLGQLVHAAVGTARVLGIVTTISNVPIDSSRRPAARGENSEDEEALRRAHPELSRLVRTEFEAILVGYETENDAVIHHGYPPRPPVHGRCLLRRSHSRGSRESRSSGPSCCRRGRSVRGARGGLRIVQARLRQTAGASLQSGPDPA